jgi:hypothetical protein
MKNLLSFLFRTHITLEDNEVALTLDPDNYCITLYIPQQSPLPTSSTLFSILAIKMKDFNWIKKFIEENKSVLDKREI